MGESLRSCIFTAHQSGLRIIVQTPEDPLIQESLSKGRGGEANRPGKPFRNQGKPARGQEKEICDDVSDEGNEEETSE